MRASTCFRIGAVLAGLAVALGAFAAHGMKSSGLDDARYSPDALATFETGVRYQLYHALALLVCGLLADRGYRTGFAALAFTVGIVLFSGSLYGLVLTDAKWLGPVTPIGGVAFLAGWIRLAALGAPVR
jgi:uncharacterized membrane protein YgdD (TMEM256/DUF423 family)